VTFPDGSRPDDAGRHVGWIEHFRAGEPALARLLAEAAVLIHPFVVGELACGNLKKYAIVLSDLGTLPVSKPAPQDEVLQLIEDRRLWATGWVDGHLLASAFITECWRWSFDKRLRQVAQAAGVAD
jgi:hypothetical protein